MKNQKKIIITIVSLIIASILFLGVVEYSQRTGEASQGWWSVYFVAPYDNKSLDFIIENYDNKTEFSYEIIFGNETVKSDNVIVEKGDFKNIEIDIERDENKSTEIKINLAGEKDGKSLFRR